MKTLLVASEGGHLIELQLISTLLNITDRSWVTFDSIQSRSMLANETVYFAPFAGSRDLIGTARAAIWTRDFLRRHQFDAVVSTGASIAVAVLPLAARAGVDCSYYETSTRPFGPSLTGRLLEPFSSIQLYTQFESWADKRWKYRACIFDIFRPEPVVAQATPPRRIVVSLGLHPGYSFRRAVERLARIIPDGTEVLWQVGDADTSGLGIEAHASLPTAKLTRAMADSDAVILHAGVGSIVTALQLGKRPVILPRRKEFREHVDDHQLYLAAELTKRDLVISREADELQWADIIEATSWRIEKTPNSTAGIPARA